MKSLLLIGVPLIAVTASSLAFACSPPLDLTQIDILPVATPTAVAYSLTGDAPDAGQATLIGPEGEVEGVVERSEKLWNIVLFRPTEPLAPGEYQLTVTAGYDFEGSTATEVVVVTESLPPAEIDLQLVGRNQESWTDAVCCSTVEDGCFDSCGGDCSVCWPAGYEYSRAVDITVGSSQPRVVEVELTSDVEDGPLRYIQLAPWGEDARTSMFGASKDAGEVCVVVTELDFEGNELSVVEECLQVADDFPEIEPREPDFPDLVAQCAEPADDTEDPNWKRHAKRSQARPGCSTAGDPSTPVLVLLMLAVFGLRRTLGARDKAQSSFRG